MAISKLDDKVILAGTDDGQLHITRNGGTSWTSIRENIKDVPEGIWVSRVEASMHVPGRAYVTFDGHRSDHNAPYVFVTENYGKSWKPMMGALPADMVIRVVREDPVNPELLYIGTETGIWLSIDRGDSWFRFMPNMPTVSVNDIAIHPRDHALVAASHGRSLFVMDNINALQQLNDEVLESDFHLFEQPLATLWENVSRGGQRGHFLYAGENPDVIRPVSSIPRARFEVDIPIYYFAGNKDSIELTLEISNDSGVFTKTINTGPGLNKLMWNRVFNPQPYSADEQEQVETAFAKLDTARSYFRRSLKRFQNAGDSIAVKRKLVSDLISFLNVDSSLGIIKANAGTYQVSLIYGDIRKTQRLIIRPDPLLNEE